MFRAMLLFVFIFRATCSLDRRASGRLPWFALFCHATQARCRAFARALWLEERAMQTTSGTAESLLRLQNGVSPSCDRVGEGKPSAPASPRAPARRRPGPLCYRSVLPRPQLLSSPLLSSPLLSPSLPFSPLYAALCQRVHSRSSRNPGNEGCLRLEQKRSERAERRSFRAT